MEIWIKNSPALLANKQEEIMEGWKRAKEVREEGALLIALNIWIPHLLCD